MDSSSCKWREQSLDHDTFSLDALKFSYHNKNWKIRQQCKKDENIESKERAIPFLQRSDLFLAQDSFLCLIIIL